MMKEQIESALLAASANRAGASVPAQSQAVRQNMIDSGLMTKDVNLTRRGADCRAIVARRKEDEAFGG